MRGAFVGLSLAVRLLPAGAGAEDLFGAVGGAVHGVEHVFVHPETETTTSTTATASTTTSPFLIEESVDLPGNDLRAVDAPSAEACLQQCSDARGCIAFAWRRRDRHKACYLKGVLPRPILTKVHDTAVTSGYLVGTMVAAPLPTTSLFCFSVVRLHTYEHALMKVQYESGKSIFACDEYAVLSNRSIEVVPGVITRLVNSSMSARYGGKYNTALNNNIFMAAWDRVLRDGRYARHRWTAKVDPDSVFFPQRLRNIVARYPDETMYLTNCRYGLHGPLEVFSLGAVEAFRLGKPHCLELFEGEEWGEDQFIDNCLGMLQVTRHFELESLLVEDHCDPPVGWQNCRNGRVAALHPFKNEEEWAACAFTSNQATEYTWARHVGYTLAGFQTVENMRSDDIEAIKHHVEMRGYVGFVLQGSEALLKAPVPNTMGWLAETSDDEVAYLFGLPHIPTAPPEQPPPASAGDEQDKSCLVQAEPVYSFSNFGLQDHTFHFQPAWPGENEDKMVFYAFRKQALGSLPVFDFWRRGPSRGHSDRVFHMGVPDPGEEIGRIQFYAYPTPGPDRVPVSSFRQTSSAEITTHSGDPWEGEELLGSSFWAPAWTLKAPALSFEQCNACFEEDGAVWEPTMAGQAISTEASATVCQQRCATTPGCKFFSFDLARRWCSLSYGHATLRPNLPGTIRGPARCDEDTAAVPIVRKDAQANGPVWLLLAAPMGQAWLPAVAAMLLAGLGRLTYSRISKAKVGRCLTVSRLLQSERELFTGRCPVHQEAQALVQPEAEVIDIEDAA